MMREAMMHMGTSYLCVLAVDSDGMTRQVHLRIDEPHFTLVVIFFSVMLEFGGDYPLSEHAPHFHQIVLLISTNE
jgi:hypothetical protein